MYSITPISNSVGKIELPANGHAAITVIASEKLRNSFDQKCLEQAVNSRLAPGVTDLILNPDAHAGYGAPVGCVMVSPTHIYPGPVGVDIKCSMSLLQTDLSEEELKSKPVRRAMIDSILSRIPTGPGKGQRSVKKSRSIGYQEARNFAVHGGTKKCCQNIGIDEKWLSACEDPFHLDHKGSTSSLEERFNFHQQQKGKDFIYEKLLQVGSYGGGNHFGESNVVRIKQSESEIAKSFGLLDGKIAFLSHCGSRGFGYYLAQEQFRLLQMQFVQKNISFPGNDKELVYAELGSQEANNYLDDLALASNFATINHLLINTLVLESFQEVFPGTKGNLVYFISHNIAREEVINGKLSWVHRKGATRAFPKAHPELLGTRYEHSGHPILLPGNPISGSAVMVANQDADISCYSVNHGAGRTMSRRRALKELSQKEIDNSFEKYDILSNCRQYPKDEAPAAYKDFDEVLRSVELVGLAKTVAKLDARFVIKDGDQSNNQVA